MQSINPIDRDALRDQFRHAQPFPFFCIDNFLKEDFAEAVLASFPSFSQAKEVGRAFQGVNEKGKVQVGESRSHDRVAVQSAEHVH